MPDYGAVFAEVDTRHERHRKVTLRDVEILFGERPQHDTVWCSSPYDIVSEWNAVMLSYPQLERRRQSTASRAIRS